jgi:hypothetical protein
MRKWLIGCGALAGIALLLCVGALVWLWVPPRIELPPRQYPPNNAYPEYRTLGEEMQRRVRSDARLQRISRAISARQPLSAADRAYYLQQMAPYLRRYEQLTQRPSVVVYERDLLSAPFRELAEVRELARIDAYFMREELRQRRYRDAIRRAERLRRLADQVRNGGPLIHYLVGTAVNAISIDPIREELPRIYDRAALEALLQLARTYEQQRVPLWKCIEEEYYFGLNMYYKLATGRLSAEQLTDSPPDSSLEQIARRFGGVVDRYLAKDAIPEYRRIMTRFIEEFKQPFGKRPMRTEADIEKETRNPLNKTLLPVFAKVSDKEASEVAVMRLIGCAAAIRLHKLRTGNYPASLEALRPELGEMIIDPFSGKPFVYRTDPRFGFLLYSVSLNRMDDGGATTYQGFPDVRGDLSPVKVPIPDHLKGTPPQQMPLVAPLWMR